MDNNNNKPLISICIPAYKRPDYLRRLLDSIVLQDFKDFEIIISDDSPDETVKSLLGEYKELNFHYYHNQPSLGTPANWNFAISKAGGNWIKIMHDDDWFPDRSSLGKFVELTAEDKNLIFSGYHNIYENGRAEKKFIPDSWYEEIKKNPLVLLSENVIGPPSVMLIKKQAWKPFDVRMKWRVDIDYYVQLIQEQQDFSFTQESLVNVGISDSQVTNDCINVPEVELPEGYLLLSKYGTRSLKNIRVYDAWWRIFRNVKVRSFNDLEAYVPGGKWPLAIRQMINHSGRIPSFLLSFGLFSKIFMVISYLVNYNRLK